MKAFATVITLVIVALASYFFFFNAPDNTLPETLVDEPLSPLSESPSEYAPTAEAPPPLTPETVQSMGLAPLTTLDDSDAYLAQLIKETAPWEPLILLKDKLRTVAAAIDRLAQDQNPNAQLSFLKPTEKFKTQSQEDQVFLSEENYSRYSPMISMIRQIDASFAAAAYRHIYPLLDQAYQELGNGDDALAEKISGIMERISRFSSPPTEPELIGKEGLFIFANPEYEMATPLEKALMRMGPENTRVLQQKIQEFQTALQVKQGQ